MNKLDERTLHFIKIHLQTKYFKRIITYSQFFTN